MTSDADEQHLTDLATTLNQRINDLGAKAARSGSPAQLLAMVALGLADDLSASEERLEQLQGATRRVVQAAIDRIDRRLASDAQEATEASEA
jgi:cell division protein ZapA (FtsZ GTPase activity inhibitor)